MSEISNVLVYALKIKYNYILSLYFKTCTKGLKGGGQFGGQRRRQGEE